jgi:hypothetical protein
MKEGNLIFWQMSQDCKKDLNILQNEADISRTEISKQTEGVTKPT